MKQEENKYSKIQYFLWLVAGSEISVLKKCPNDYNRHANIGLMIIITSLFAGMTAFIAGSTFEKENLNQLAARQKKFIDNLNAALIRIENKTFGVCRVTGKLIQKERLLAVPHATLSMEAKLKQYK
jgi:hypothetical protein